ncbi:MAG: phosphopeptide-binding protein [Saprospiraceae bacterium]|nr:phosphopeptide-binding protein [Saprospiraceae bacterium]MBK9722049.1 phosphopeptide-binding protein [Saprospiraceae bacterium]
MKNSFLIPGFVILLCALSSCKSKIETNASTQTKPVEVTLSAFEPSLEFADATISSMDYQKGMFKFSVQGNYQLGQQTPDAPQKMCANSDKGQHIHLIIDNKPYEAKYEAEFHYKIEDGSHFILAFLSRSYHESIKNPKAAVLVKAEIMDSTFKKLQPVTDPMLFYSRPKGAYVGNDTKKIMLDFYLSNCQLGAQYKVKAEVNGKEFLIDTWQAYYLEGLPMGENKIKLSLIDSTGALVNTPLNPVERSFTLQAEPGK